MLKKVTIISFTLSLLFFAGYVQGQDVEKNIYKADKYFKIRNYNEALVLYLKVIEAGINDPMIYYRTAASYLHMPQISEQVKSIPYFEYAIENGKDLLPSRVYFDLGNIYHKDDRVEKAITFYSKYKSTLKRNSSDLAEVNRALEIANNALSMMSMAKDITIRNVGAVINTQYTEYNPVVSADEGAMAFTALRPGTGKTRNGRLIEEIFVAYNKSGTWSQPQPVKVASDYNVGTAGMSADGQRMLIFIGGATGEGNLYAIDKSGKEWSQPVTLGNKINSGSLETTASITPDSKTLYFSSSRPGGYGGLDIYKSIKNEEGAWGSPVNLGPEVNTKYDEDAPFIHPDQWTLFFTSNGHNTMGGRDIFVTRIFNDEWTTPENMGYPINTTSNDNYFTLTADGRKGYFSSDRKGGEGGQDIYTLNMPEEETNIPLTMIKGRILDGETKQALPTTIYIIDVESGKKLDFVYQPDPKTGNYLIILPPAKNYDMIIESEGFLPYTLNINIPGQTQFYELYQEILLNTIKQFDVVVGQEVEVKNAFYNTHEAAVNDIRKTHEAALIKNDSIDVYDLMSDLIAAEDQEGINYLVSLINMQNPLDDTSFKEAGKVEAASRVYYYDESDESKFEQKKVDGKTIFSLPTMYVTEEAEKQKQKKTENAVSYDVSLLKRVVKVYFDASESALEPKYHTSLNKTMETLKQHPALGLQVSGYASADGDEKFNRELSNKRAIAVLDYINQKGIVRRRIIARGYGATKNENSSKEESRRVEIQVVDLNQHDRVVR